MRRDSIALLGRNRIQGKQHRNWTVFIAAILHASGVWMPRRVLPTLDLSNLSGLDIMDSRLCHSKTSLEHCIPTGVGVCTLSVGPGSHDGNPGKMEISAKAILGVRYLRRSNP